MFRWSRRHDDIVGYAFSGGGSRAASQIGGLKALAEAGIRPHLVAGTSAGAVNAAWFALHPEDLGSLEAIWLRLRTQDVFPGNRIRILMNLAREGFVHRADMWERFLRSQVGDTRLEDTVLPCAIVAVRLRDGQRVVFESGEIVAALMASTAIPGVFPPYVIDGEQYVDGGVLEYMPIPTLLERHADTIWALDCSAFEPELTADVSVVDRCARFGAHAYVEREIRLTAMRGHTVHLLQPPLPEYRDAREFAHTTKLIAAGYKDAQAYLRKLSNEPRPAGSVKPRAG